MQGLEALGELRVLDVSVNRLESLGDLSCHPRLTDLWANNNRLGSLDEVEAVLQPISATLSCLYLTGNPCADEPQYARRLRLALPKLEQLDDAVLS